MVLAGKKAGAGRAVAGGDRLPQSWMPDVLGIVGAIESPKGRFPELLKISKNCGRIAAAFTPLVGRPMSG
jgi:hypothetical protein